jgi:hypothetical protein
MSNNEKPKAKVLFIPQTPAKHVKEWLRKNPEADWRDSINYVLDNYPQTRRDGRLNYLIEGGTAIHFLYPERPEPADIDIISKSKRMKRDFNGVSKVDVKLVREWFQFRFIPFNAAVSGLLFSLKEEVEFEGRSIWILNAMGLSAAKTLPYLRIPPRSKDIEDMNFLDPENEKLMDLQQQLTSNWQSL